MQTKHSQNQPISTYHFIVVGLHRNEEVFYSVGITNQKLFGFGRIFF